MSENETINPADIPQVEKSKSLGISKIGGEEIFITGYTHNRGKPTQYTNPKDIGDDGLTDYYVIKTEKPFNLTYKDEGTVPINSFFVTDAIAQQIERIPNYQTVNSGGRIGPVKAVKRKSTKTGNPYWCLAFQKDEDF